MNIVYNYFLTELFQGNIDFENNAFRVALLSGGYNPDPTHTTLESISAYEVMGNGYTSGGALLENVQVVEIEGIPYVTADNTIWENSTLSAQYAVIVKNGNLIACYDFGSIKESLNGTFTVQWAENGLLSVEQ